MRSCSTGVLAVAAMVVAMSMPVTASAVTGMSGSGSAGVAQYTAGDVRGDSSPGETGDRGSATPLGSPNAGSVDARGRTQVEAADGTGTSLPFTGFLVIPFLAAGIALLAGGLLLRGKFSTARTRTA